MSLRTRSFLRMAILLSLSVLVIGISTAMFLIKDHRHREKDSLGSESALIAKQAEKSILWDDRMALKELIDQQVRNHPGMRYIFITRAGRPYVHTFEAGVPKAFLRLPGGEGNKPTATTIQSRRGETLYDVAARIGQGDSVLHVGASRKDIDRHARDEIALVALWGAATVVLGLFLAFGISAITVREVDEMTQGLRENDEGLRQANKRLREEIAERKRTEAELSAINKVLASEIAHRERAEAELWESEQKFRVLFEVSSDAIMTLAPPTWRFTSGNPATVKMFQARDEVQFVSKAPWDVSPEFQPDGTRSDDKAKAMIGKAMQEGSHFFEWDHMRLDGEVFPATVLLTRATLGDKVFLQATVRDITEVKKATEKLRRSEEEYRSLFENMLNGFACCEMLFENGRPEDFVYLKVNDAFERLTGLKDVVGKKVTEVIPGIKESNPELFEIYGRVALTGKPESFEVHLNTIGWLSISVHSPKEGYFVAVFENITERKEAEEQIRQNSQIQTTLNGLLSLSLEELTMEDMLQQAIGHIASAAGSAFESKGAIFLADDKEEMLVMAAQQGMDVPLLAMCARVPFGKCTCGRAALSGETQFVHCVDERHENTFEGIPPHGHYCVPILSSGKVVGVINTYIKEGHVRRQEEEEFLRAAAAVLAGIIERKRAEQELKVAAEQWSTTFNSIADLVSVQDMNHRLVRVNAAYVGAFGKSPEQLVGRACHEIVHGRQAPWPDCPCKIVFETGKPARVEIFEPSLGVHLEVSVSPLFGPKGEVAGCVHIAKNITERKQAELKQTELLEQLAGTNQELRDFAYVISHDLKAPLRAIRTLAEWLCADYQDKLDEQGKENLQLLGGRVNRMQNLIDGVLQYSRIGRTEQGTAPVDLRQIVPEIIENLGAPEHVSIRIESDLPTLEADTTRVTQVFQNLLSNAIKYMDKPQGNITVGCVEENGFWKFSVCDNGPGIEEKYFERIFKLFQTLAPRDSSEGTGVGLTITKKIVEMYGGRIWVESEVGRGSTFFFTFPKKGKADVAACAPPAGHSTDAGYAGQDGVLVGGQANAV